MKRLLAVLAAVLIIATACGSSGEPETFGEQFATLSAAQQAAFGISDSEIPVELRNWMEGCVAAAGESSDTSVSNPGAACRCSFDGIVEFLLEFASGEPTEEQQQQVAFQRFKDISSAAENGDVLQSDIRSIIEGCNT